MMATSASTRQRQKMTIHWIFANRTAALPGPTSAELSMDALKRAAARAGMLGRFADMG